MSKKSQSPDPDPALHAGSSVRNGRSSASDPDPEDRAFLIRFSKAVQKYGLYPPEHPALMSLAEQVHEELERALAASAGNLALGVAPDRILLSPREGEESGPRPGETAPARRDALGGDPSREDATETDPDHPILRSLAERLHGHDVARLVFTGGIPASEVAELLAALRELPDAEETRLGHREELHRRWRRVQVDPVDYDRLGLAPEDPARGGRSGTGADADDSASPADAADSASPAVDADAAGRLWRKLANAALLGDAHEGGSPGGRAADILQEADVPSAANASGAAAQRAEVRLMELSAAFSGSDREAAASLRRHFARLLETVDPDDLYDALMEGTGSDERHRFLEAAAESMPAAVAVDLAAAAVRRGELDLSPWMVRLLSRLAEHVREGSGRRAREAEASIRAQLGGALAGWRGTGDSAGEDAAGDAAGDADSAPAIEIEPIGLADPDGAGGPPAERILQLAIEVDDLGPAAEHAFRSLAEDGSPGEVVRVLHRAPPDGRVGRELWERLARQDAAGRLLRREPPDLEGVGYLIERIGARAASPMLDLLESSESRSVRGKLFAHLVSLGSEIFLEVAARLEDERWYVRRNLLALLAEMSEKPDIFSALPYADDPHPAVRREAYKMLLRDPEHRGEVILAALRDDHPRAVSLGLAAAEISSFPDEAVPLIIAHVRDGSLEPEIRVLGVRALRHTSDRRARRVLVGLCRRGSWWSFWKRRLAPKSPLMLEALRGLAARWPDHRETAALLRAARGSEDAEVRRAAAGDVGGSDGADGAGHDADGAGHDADGAGHDADGAGHDADGAGHDADGAGHDARGAGDMARDTAP